MKKNIIKYLLMPLAISTVGCANYLSQDPEQFNSIDKIFQSRVQTLLWYNRIYSNDFMVQNMHYSGQIHYFWWTDESAYTQEPMIRNISEGRVGPDTNYGYTGYNLYYFQRYYQAIRHCNLFLENVDRCPDIPEVNRRTYVAETRFMRAYYHYELFRLYGPIPLEESSRQADDVAAPQARATAQQCVDWIASEINWACDNGLPMTRKADEYGMPTVGAAKAILSRMLLMVASPLYNGNAVYKNWTNRDGTLLMPQTYIAERWKDAADAAKSVIDSYGYELLKPKAGATFTEKVDNYRAITTTWNTELIWGWPNTTQWYSKCALPARWFGWNGRYSLAIGQVNSYFMANGDESKSLESWFANKQFSTAAGDGTIAQTFWMFVGREPRFYASIHFPNQRLSYAYDNSADNIQEADGYGVVDFWYSGLSGNGSTPGDKNTSGFSVRKNIPLDHHSNKQTGTDTWNLYVPFPIIRLGEIYLNYAEALNEYYGISKHSEVLTYLNEIRVRAGIPGYPTAAPYTKEEMREMIHHERRVELAWECNRFFDVRRWFVAHGPEGLFNHDEYGLNMSYGTGPTDTQFFTLTKVANKGFNIQHYFLPIRSNEVKLNTQLVQAPFY